MTRPRERGFRVLGAASALKSTYAARLEPSQDHHFTTSVSVGERSCLYAFFGYLFGWRPGQLLFFV
jgi:hypothetical protein